VTVVNRKTKLRDVEKKSNGKVVECEKRLKMWNMLDFSNGSVTPKLRQTDVRLCGFWFLSAKYMYGNSGTGTGI
jgi:hypothetical protein